MNISIGFLNKGGKINKVVILDGGNILHKSIFSYMGQYDSYVDAEISKLGFDPKDKEKLSINPFIKTQAISIVENKISRREIFLMPPIYTYMRMVIGYFKLLSVDLEDTIIISQDFGSWRKKIDKTYKAQRKAVKEQRRDSGWWTQQYEAFNDFFPKLEECLPWHFIKLFEIEADDIASVCCRYYKNNDIILISSDRDWEQLCYYEGVRIFSPITKKFKVVPNPIAVLLEKIRGDVSDNLLTVPSSEAEYDRRKKIVNLLELPDHIEKQIRKVLVELPIKNIEVNLVPFPSVRKEVKKLYAKDLI